MVSGWWARTASRCGFEYCIYRKMKINDRKDDRLEVTLLMLLLMLVQLLVLALQRERPIFFWPLLLSTDGESPVFGSNVLLFACQVVLPSAPKQCNNLPLWLKETPRKGSQNGRKRVQSLGSICDRIKSHPHSLGQCTLGIICFQVSALSLCVARQY